MKANELREKSVADLNSDLEGLLKQQFDYRMQHGVGQLPHSHELKRVRRDIARVKTVLAEKQAKGEA